MPAIGGWTMSKTRGRRTNPRRAVAARKIVRVASPRQNSAGGKRRAANDTAPVTIRHYCQGIGDCHLLRFSKSDGSPFFMLIDCGVHSSVSGGNAYIADVVTDIGKVTKHIDVLVLTHEHWDHISGFYTAAEQFKEFTYGEIWLGWTENPADPQARKLDKFKGEALTALQAASHRLD